MSLPIYLTPLEDDIIEELKLQGFNDNTIKSITNDFKGRKREEELLTFLINNRNKNLKSKDIIAKSIKIKNKFDMFWGYIIDKNGDEIYRPDLFKKV